MYRLTSILLFILHSHLFRQNLSCIVDHQELELSVDISLTSVTEAEQLPPSEIEVALASQSSMWPGRRFLSDTAVHHSIQSGFSLSFINLNYYGQFEITCSKSEPQGISSPGSSSCHGFHFHNRQGMPCVVQVEPLTSREP